MKRLALALVALAFAAPAHAATCTAAEKQAAVTALAAYRKAMPKQRAAYFKKHKSPKQRKAFVKKQQVKLKRLQQAAVCEVPPPDTTPPHLLSASVDGATVTVSFDDDVVLSSAVFTVHVNGTGQTPQAATPTGKTVVLTLAQAVGGDDVVRLDYSGGVTDAAGNPAPGATGVVVGNATPAPCSFMVSTGGLHGQNEGATDYTMYERATGELRGIVLWVDFPNAPGTESIATLTEQVVRPAESAYASMSYGRFALKIDAAPRWYTLPQTSAYYGLNAADGAGRKDGYIAAAIQAADADVDFGRYRVVYLVASSGASADMTASTQRPPGSPLAIADGSELRHAVLLGTHRLQEPAHGSEGVIHETGHVLGLPDLYGDPTALGGWDPMSFSVLPGAEFFSWHRWKLGWLEPPQVRCVQPGRTVDATLTPLETAGGLKMVVAPLDATRALVLENRQPTGLDAKLCDKGVVAYTVDGSVAFPGAPVRVLPAHPGTDTDGAKQQQCGPKYDAPLDLGTGETPTLRDTDTGITVELMAGTGSSYIVRVTRSP